MTCYYEINHGKYGLLLEGGFYSFSSYEQMVAFVDDDSVLFIEVTPDNWADLYESGAFHES